MAEKEVLDIRPWGDNLWFRNGVNNETQELILCPYSYYGFYEKHFIKSYIAKNLQALEVVKIVVREDDYTVYDDHGEDGSVIGFIMLIAQAIDWNARSRNCQVRLHLQNYHGGGFGYCAERNCDCIMKDIAALLFEKLEINNILPEWDRDNTCLETVKFLDLHSPLPALLKASMEVRRMKIIESLVLTFDGNPQTFSQEPQITLKYFCPISDYPEEFEHDTDFPCSQMLGSISHAPLLRLKVLNLGFTGMMTKTDVASLSDYIQQPSCAMTSLMLMGGHDIGSFVSGSSDAAEELALGLRLIQAVTSSPNLKYVHLSFGLAARNNDTAISYYIKALATTSKITHLLLELMEFDFMDTNVRDPNKKSRLLGAMEANKNLEDVQLFPFSRDAEFQKSLDSYCARNKKLKFKNTLCAFKEGTLCPAAIIPALTRISKVNQGSKRRVGRGDGQWGRVKEQWDPSHSASLLFSMMTGNPQAPFMDRIAEHFQATANKDEGQQKSDDDGSKVSADNPPKNKRKIEDV